MTGQHSLTPTKAIPSACVYMCVSRTRASLLALSMCKRAFVRPSSHAPELGSPFCSPTYMQIYGV